MSYQTPKWLMILRVAAVPWKVILILGLLFGMVPGVGILALVVAVVAAMMWIIALLVRLFGNAIYGSDPDYKKWRAAGGASLLLTAARSTSTTIRLPCGPVAGQNRRPTLSPMIGWYNARPAAHLTETRGICWHCGQDLSGTLPADRPPDDFWAEPAPAANEPVVCEPRTAKCPKCRGLVGEARIRQVRDRGSLPVLPNGNSDHSTAAQSSYVTTFNGLHKLWSACARTGLRWIRAGSQVSILPNNVVRCATSGLGGKTIMKDIEHILQQLSSAG